MKLKNILQIILVLCMSSSVAQIVSIPDPNFKTALLNHDPVIDTNGDGEIQFSEAEGFMEAMDVSGQNISDLTGIESFINIEILLAHFNNIEQLDTSQNTALKRIGLTANQLSEIDVNQNTALTLLWLAGNVDISSLDLSQNTVLDTLSIQGLTNLTQLDISQNTGLIYLRGDAASLTELDISQNTELRLLNLSHNNLSEINTSQNNDLTYLGVGSNHLVQLDVSENPFLTSLGANDNLLTEFNIANGNNENLFLYAINNPDLSCIQVDEDIIGNIPESWEYDDGLEFSVDCQSLNIEEHKLNNLLLYPNPASASIKLANLPLNSTISILDVSGKKVFERLAFDSQTTISVAHFKSGVYFVRIVDMQENTTTKKLIISR